MPMTFIAYYASIPSHSPYYPTHSPHHRPVPFAQIVFPPDPPHTHSNSDTDMQTNPTHGQKVTTDPAGRHDPKLENSGPVASDSLAADSLRSGGAFSAGNPTGISGARGSSGTFAVDPAEGGNVRILHGKKEDILSSGKGGHPDSEVREKAKETPISGGGSQAQGAFNVSHDELESKDATGRRLGASKNSDGGLSASKYADGGGVSGDAEGRGSRHTAASGGSGGSGGSGSSSEPHAKRVVPNTARSEETLEEGLDWSKVSKDTVSTTDIGGPDDPGRVAEKHMAKQVGRKDQGLGYTGGKMGGDSDNSFDVLNDTEGAPGVENPSRS